jgi:hypothetical protein
MSKEFNMNIFYLHHDPVTCAAMHCDKHVVKMILEYGQMLSTAHRVLDGTPVMREGSKKPVVCGYTMADPNMEELLYKATHKNHPSNVWVRQSSEHYGWLVELFVALSFEYERRYHRKHKTFIKLSKLLTSPPTRIPHDPFVPPPQAMPDEYKDDDTITAYRKFYVLDKHDRRGIVNYKDIIDDEDDPINYIDEWKLEHDWA